VTPVENHLGSYILRRTAESPGLPACLQLLGEAKVYQLHISAFVEQQILRLQIPVDYVPRMQVIEGLHHTRRVEAGGAVIKVALVSQNCPKLSAQATLHQHVQVLFVLEGFEQLHDELAIGLAHDLLFGHDMLLLSRLHDL